MDDVINNIQSTLSPSIQSQKVAHVTKNRNARVREQKSFIRPYCIVVKFLFNVVSVGMFVNDTGCISKPSIRM